MTVIEHNKILAIGFAVFSTIFAFTSLLLLVVSLGVFVSLGITFANETGDSNQAGIGIIGGIVTVIFYGFRGAIFAVPTALASRKMLKGRRNARAALSPQSWFCPSCRWERCSGFTVCGFSSVRKADDSTRVLSPTFQAFEVPTQG